MALDLGLQVRRGKFWGLAGAIKELGSNDWKAALDLLQACMHWERWNDPLLICGPDIAAFNAAVTILGSNSLWSKSLALVDTMNKSGLQPNIITVGGLQRAVPASRWLQAIQFFNDLPRQMLEANVILVNSVLADTRSQQRWRFGLNFLEAALSNGLELHVISLNSAVMVSGQLSWESSLSMLHHVHAASISPDAITCNSCIQCCSEASSWSRVLVLTFEGEQSPNISGFNAAINGLSSAHQWLQANPEVVMCVYTSPTFLYI